MIYLDHAAYTPTERVAIDAMREVLESSWGNPNSPHAAGRRARIALEQARAEVAEYLGAEPRSVHFAASATEALKRVLELVMSMTEGPVVSSRLEHPAVLVPLDESEQQGREHRWIARPGGAMPESRTVLVDASVLVVAPADHELGSVVDVARLTSAVPESCWCVFDCTQIAAWMDIHALLGPRRVVVISAPKLGGPPGIAAVVVPDELSAESSFWPGTPSWCLAVGLGAACRARALRRAEELRRVRSLGITLRDGLLECAAGAVENLGSDVEHLGSIVNISIPEVASVRLTTALDLDGVCVATGAACTRKNSDGNLSVRAAWPSEPWRASTATRWSLGWSTTEEDIRGALDAFRRALVCVGYPGHPDRYFR